MTKEKEYTEAELKQMQQQMTAYYKEQVKLLKPQEEYERLQADIAEHKARRFHSMIRLAQMQAGPPEEESDPEEEAPVKERTLKTE